MKGILFYHISGYSSTSILRFLLGTCQGIFMPFIFRLLFFGIFISIVLPVLPMGPMGFGQKPGADQKDDKKKPRKNPLIEKPLPELKTGLEAALKSKDYATAVKYLDAMRVVSTDHEQIKEILLQMADLYYLQEEWTKAERAYNEFILLYPGAARCDYAHFKAVECGFKLTSQPDRDQTKTQEILTLAEEFVTTHPKSEFMGEVTRLATQCREKLFASDINIFNFYLHRNNLKAAQKRLDYMAKEYTPQLPQSQPKVLELTIELAQAQNNPAKVWEAQLQLVNKFPDNDITKRLALSAEQIKKNLDESVTLKT
jgi:outer membrane assembly lipoprotein YfiO